LPPQGKLSVFEVHEVQGALRAALEEERAALLDDIEYLTAVLSDEADLQASTAHTPGGVRLFCE
jgi:hypothetical protein